MILNLICVLNLLLQNISLFLQHYEPADDWSEHISSSGKKYYYNCRTEVSQWEKPKEWLERYFILKQFYHQHVAYGVLKRIYIYLFYLSFFCFLIREQRQKEATKMAVVNSFPKDRDYRREAMQATATSGFSSGSK